MEDEIVCQMDSADLLFLVDVVLPCIEGLPKTIAQAVLFHIVPLVPITCRRGPVATAISVAKRVIVRSHVQILVAEDQLVFNNS
jgi:hypothetical protein